VRWRRSPHLVAFWRGGDLVFHNYATNRAAPATPIVCSLLDFCGDWRGRGEIRDALPEADAGLVDALVRKLAALTFLQRSDRDVDPRERAMASLERWNPAAGFFHTATRDVRFLPASVAARTLARQARSWPTPPFVKRVRGAARTRLPAIRREGEFPSVLLSRRTWRRFSPDPLTLEELGTVLGLSCGVQRWVVGGQPEMPLKTSPSGGARHPLESYVVVRRVSGLRPGTYHYAADIHALERLSGRSSEALLRAYMPHSDYFAKAAVLVLFSAVFERQLWRYPYARAYRAALVEAGHVCQTFCLTATWLGLAPFCIMGLADSRIDHDLGLDGAGESVLYAAGLGRRPARTPWAPLARGTLQTRPNPAFRV
jgi:SagB-type dehydrogenase family enzyme